MPDTDLSRRNRISLAPTSIGDVGPVEFIEICGRAGYDAIGLRVQPSPGRPSTPVVGQPALIKDMKAALSDNGLGVLELFTFYIAPEADFDDYARALEVGADFGATWCTVCGNDPDWGRMRDNLARFCDLAAGFGLGATLEFAPVHVMSTLEKAVALYREIDRPNAGILVDPVHFIRGGGRVEDLRALDGSMFPFAQIADGVLLPGEPPAELGPQMGSGERRLTGAGTMPLTEILDAMPQGLPLSVECLPRPDGMSAQTWADENLRTTRQFLQRYYSRTGADA